MGTRAKCGYSRNMDLVKTWGIYTPGEYGEQKDKCKTTRTPGINAPTEVNQHTIQITATRQIIDTAYIRYNQDGTKMVLLRPKQEMQIIQKTKQSKMEQTTIKTNEQTKNGRTH